MIGSPFERDRGEGCLSDLALDRLVGEGETHRHLHECEDCRGRHRALDAERRRFAESGPPLRRPRARWQSALSLAVAASIAAVIFLPKGSENGFRSKGGPEIFFYVKHQEEVRRGSKDGEKVAPHDSIRFAYTADQPYHLAVFSIDPKSVVSVYYPQGEQTRAEPPGADIALPLSTILDDTLGAERIVAFFCRDPIDVASVKREIGTSEGASLGCHMQTFRWTKAR